ncbi:MAG: hypothetical protein KF861_16915 [Planctomycetaceae bacterium]|nr:hypothetical protein [Planctomycetaceae bacterium]
MSCLGVSLLFIQPFAAVSFAQTKQAAFPAAPRGVVIIEPHIPAEVQGTLRSFNESLSRGLDPNDNAAVILVDVCGEGVFEPALRDASMAMLGMEAFSPAGPRFEYIPAYCQRVSTSDSDWEQLYERLQTQLLTALEEPWQRAEREDLAAYLDVNSAALDAVVEAANRPRYYAPLLSTEDPPRLMSGSFLIEHRLPFLTRCLASRGLFRFAEGNFDAAAKDLMACHKLAALLAAGSPLDVSNAKSQSLDANAFMAEKALLQSGQLTKEQTIALLESIRQLPALPTAEFAADRGERAILHQEIEFLKAEAITLDDYLEVEREGADLDRRSPSVVLQWDQALRRADELQDRIVEAFRLDDREIQSAQFQILDSELKAWRARNETEENQLFNNLRDDPEAASQWVGEDMARALQSNCWQRRHTDDRAAVRRRLIEIGLALKAFQLEHHEFPAALDGLAPFFLPEIPLDPYSQVAFSYVRDSDQQVRLICWGANQDDDAGKIFNDDVMLIVR